MFLLIGCCLFSREPRIQKHFLVLKNWPGIVLLTYKKVIFYIMGLSGKSKLYIISSLPAQISSKYPKIAILRYKVADRNLTAKRQTKRNSFVTWDSNQEGFYVSYDESCEVQILVVFHLQGEMRGVSISSQMLHMLSPIFNQSFVCSKSFC